MYKLELKMKYIHNQINSTGGTIMTENDSKPTDSFPTPAKNSGLFNQFKKKDQIDTDCRRQTSREQMDCGGLNEAFVMQHWASYNPYH